MPPNQVSAQDIESARVVVVLIAVSVMAFWRLALRATIAIIAVAVALGLIALLHDLRW